MKKLADISQFERLQSNSGAVSDVSVFNMEAEEILNHIVRGNAHGETGWGISVAAEKYAKELLAEMPDELDEYEFFDRANSKAEELRKLVETDYPELVEKMWEDGDNGEDKDPDEGSYADYGGLEGICETFAYLVSEYIQRPLDTRVIERSLGVKR